MTDMSTHMEHDQANLLADLGQTPAEDVTAKGRSLGIGFYLAVGFIVVIVLAAILAPWLPLKDPEQSYVVAGERPPYSPSREFWFGTDQLSRDMFSRTIWGARISLTVGFAAIAFGMLVGGSLGMIAGYFRGRFNAVISFCFVILLSFPALVLAILITSLLDRSLFTIVVHDRHPVGRSGRHGVAGHDRFVRRPRVRARRAHARRQTPAHHRARAAPQRRHPDECVRAARRGRRHRRRGRPGVPRALGPSRASRGAS